MISIENVNIRPVEVADADNGFFEVLAQLTVAPKLPRDTFQTLLEQQDRIDLRLTLVAVDTSSNRVLATGSAMIEPKFIRSGKPCGHIEDIVVHHEARGLKLGKRIIERLTQFCEQRGCYKVILDCSEKNAPFYEKCGFAVKELQMVRYL